MIRKLRNNRKQKDLQVSDIPRSAFTGIETMSYRDPNHRNHRYRLFRYPSGATPVDDDYVKDVTKFKGDISDCPVDIYESTKNGVQINTERLVHQLVDLYGEGRINVFKLGGNPPRESIFENQFIKIIP